MKFKKMRIKIAILLIVAVILPSCTNLSKTQSVIDNIIPDHARRMYVVADLIPYTYKEIRNAQAFYGQDLTEFFTINTSTEAEAKRVTKKEKDDFYKELMYRNHNYKIIKKRCSMYLEDDAKTKEENEEARQKEYDEYYKLPTAEGADVIKKYNNGDISGMPLMSIKVIMSTATMSSIDSLASEALCEIYKPVYIKNEVYDNLKIGDKIELDVPATNSTVGASETRKVECTYVATDSLLYKNDEGKDDYYFIAGIDGTNDVRRVLDYYGRTLETYVESKYLQILSNARIVRANDPTRLMIAVAEDNLTEYAYGDLAVRALGGGFLVYEYKDFVYANMVTTNLKGYITSLTEFDNQRIDNEFYNTL